MEVSKVVIPAGGWGTRLLPVTKEIPKEMLPLAIKKGNGILMKPVLQAVFEQLYAFGVRNYCIVTGRGKREIEDHFTPDWAFLEMIKASIWKSDLMSFYRELEKSRVYFVNQARRKGFGDAILHAEDYVGRDSFLVHAGDDLVLSKGQSHLREVVDLFAEERADAVVLAEEVADPRGYGIVVGDPISSRVVKVRRIEEKPLRPLSHLAVIAVYVFRPSIFDAIRSAGFDSVGEIQLTSGIQAMINGGRKVLALKLRRGDKRIDIGTAEKYIGALASATGEGRIRFLGRS